MFSKGFAIGMYVNGGYGSDAFGGDAGLTAQLDRFPLGINVGIHEQRLDVGMNLDWIVLTSAISGTPFSWYVGPGIFANLDINSDYPGYVAWAAGARGVFGLSCLLSDNFGLYAALVPAFGYGSGFDYGYGNVEGDAADYGYGFYPNNGVHQGRSWSVDFEIGFRYSLSSKPLPETPMLNVSLPEGFYLTPDGNGNNDTVALKVKVRSAKPIATWSFDVYEPSGKLFYHREGTGRAPKNIVWDGKGSNGELVQSEVDYGYAIAATNSLGTSGETKGTLHTGILLIKNGSGYKLDLSGLVFLPNSPDLLRDESDTGKKNIELLNKLLTVIKQNKNFQIVIIGHAVNISGNVDEEKELAVLSLARADKVKEILVSLGLGSIEIQTLGKGGTQPVVPHDDKENNWKNRRVEVQFIKK